MAEKRETWLPVSEIEELGKIPLPTAAPIYQKQGAYPELKALSVKVLNVVLTGLCFLMTGTTGWFAHQILHPGSFTKAAREISKYGTVDDGKRIAELGKICPDDSDTTLSCRVLYFYKGDADTRLSMAVRP